MKKSKCYVSLLVLVAIGALSQCTPTPKEEAPSQGTATVSAEALLKNKIERGAYLVNGMGCDDCHSPKAMGAHGPEVIPELRLSGHQAGEQLAKLNDPSVLKDYALFSQSFTAFLGPWGTSFAANLTPDETGIGNWTEAQFLKAIKEGKLKGMDTTRPLLPPMPWFVYKNLTDDDLKAMYAYLMTITPVKNAVPQPVEPMAMQ